MNNQASFLEIEEIELWLNNDLNKKFFIEYVKVNYLIDLNLKKFNTSNSQKKLLEFISQQKRVKRIRKIAVFSKYAAAIVFFLGIFYFVKNDIVSEPTIVKSPKESITLKMSDGSVKIIDEKGNFKIKDKDGNELGTQNGNAIVYNDKVKIEKLVYNTLTVPYGKRFALKLSDGTKVNLNAGTSLRYPVKFIEGQNRQVYVENGEAYFNVTKDVKHPFIVSNNNVNVRVLGTQFNISSYPEDVNVSTVLVEGSVSLYNSNDAYKSENATLLKPGYLAGWNKRNKSIKIEKADIEVHTAWINGRIILKHMKFGNIIKKLERHYDVEIKNNNKSLEEELITATFDIETIEQVFEVIKELHPIEYKIKDKTITIN
ncbi:FecR family protein [Polaribacter septentrionalilitoris]|uniref:FecR family protein n=1 Tax=Polaribacter septentrionalilitoris TaxID=2494657 RepID=UPI00135A7124|nr:FecR domain-containing protein [Polaribacter septentrionalilitoris]